jgi:hypothetical protein
MGKVTLFAAAVALLVLIGVDGWLCMRTLPPVALAGSSYNRLITATSVKASPISHYNDYLFVSD